MLLQVNTSSLTLHICLRTSSIHNSTSVWAALQRWGLGLEWDGFTIKEPDGTNTLAYNRGNLYYMPSSMPMDAPKNNQICAIAGEYDQSDFAHLSPEKQHTQFNISMGCSKETATPHCQHHNKHDPECFICAQARTRDAMALTGSAKKERRLVQRKLPTQNPMLMARLLMLQRSYRVLGGWVLVL